MVKNSFPLARVETGEFPANPTTGSQLSHTENKEHNQQLPMKNIQDCYIPLYKDVNLGKRFEIKYVQKRANYLSGNQKLKLM